MNDRGLPVVLIAEDDLGDRVLLEQAFRAAGIDADLRFTAPTARNFSPICAASRRGRMPSPRT
jgi:hypothetical protein